MSRMTDDAESLELELDRLTDERLVELLTDHLSRRPRTTQLALSYALRPGDGPSGNFFDDLVLLFLEDSAHEVTCRFWNDGLSVSVFCEGGKDPTPRANRRWNSVMSAGRDAVMVALAWATAGQNDGATGADGGGAE